MVQAAAGGAAGNIKRPLRIGDYGTGGIGIIIQGLAKSVDKCRPGIDVVVRAQNQIDVIGIGNARQVLLAVRVGTLRSRIGRIMLGKHAPFRIGMLRHNLSHILLLSFASLAGAAVQHDKEHVSPDKIIISVLPVLALPDSRAVRHVEMLIEIGASRMSVFFYGRLIRHIVVAYSGRKRHAVQSQVVQKQAVMLLASKISHLISQMKEKRSFRHISRQARKNAVPAFRCHGRVFHI